MREQNAAVFPSLVVRHRPRMRALAFAILGDREEAEDVVQEAFLRGFLGLATVRHPDRVGNWLAAITGNLARTRRRQPRPEAVSLDQLQAPVPSWLDSTVLELETPAHEVREALAALSAVSRETLIAHYVEGLTCAEIAVQLASTPGAVRVRLHRAREQLRALLPALTPAIREVEMIEVTLEDVWVRVVPDTPPRLADERLRIVLLRESGGERVLPIWIGPAEGDALVLRLQGGELPRPLTSDLAASLLEAAGARVERVVVSRLEEKTFYAIVAVSAGGEVREVDARPSDALNLALRVGAPIFVDETVLEQAGLVGDLPALLDRECEELAEEGFFKTPSPGLWQPHSKELVTAFWGPARK